MPRPGDLVDSESSSEGELDVEAERLRGLESRRAERQKIKADQQHTADVLRRLREMQNAQRLADEANLRAHIRATHKHERATEDGDSRGYLRSDGLGSQQGLIPLWLEHEKRWDALDCAPLQETHGLLSKGDIPWPPGTTGILGGMAMAQVVLARNSGAAIDDEGNLKSYKALYHKASKRWHPDRFQSRFGSRIAASDSAGIAEEVNKISQQVNREWEEIRAKHG